LFFFLKGKHAKYKKYTGHSAHVTRVRWTNDDSYLVSIGGRDVATLVWKHERGRTVDVTPSIMSKTTATSVSASPAASVTLQKARGESDDSDNTDSEEEGYDSDVQHDRAMDYNQRILINHDRTKLDKKEVQRPTAANRRTV
jgi:hypothetical protein